MGTESASSAVPFEAHLDLLRSFLEHRAGITNGIDGLLNAQRTPNPYLQTRPAITRRLEDCFFGGPSLSEEQRSLRGQLETAYSAAGLKPREISYLHNDLIHPTEMLLRGVHCWQQTRWPGPTDRLQYATTLFNLYILRNLEFLSLHLWDSDPQRAPARLAEIQDLLNTLWGTSPAHQPVLVRDARWLIPLALSLVTDELAPYFEIARKVTDALPEPDALEVQRAQVRMLGGHLTSQIRAYCTRDGLALEDPSVVLRTRSSNALDLALLIQGLVALLRAYEVAVERSDADNRHQLAGAIFQGISPDPELFLNQLPLLNAYTMIEGEFILDPDAHARYSPAGERHSRLLRDYGTRIKNALPALRADLLSFKPEPGRYSPYGVLFGLPTNLVEHMGLKAIQRDAETRFSLEDIFDDDPSPAKLEWINGWRKLPHVPRDVQRAYDFPHSFADEIHTRIGRELNRAAPAAIGRLLISTSTGDLPLSHMLCSDRQQAEENGMEFCETSQFLARRMEGHFVVSYQTAGVWHGLKKELLAEILGSGRDADISKLPPEATQVVRLMSVDLL